ncbi:Inosine/uridine-preferring nucleoside hydrolase domain-containing protein [Lipomyces oligophaga]|uniref:Inosine/uridine-preferring nucleoside hydrolase domain-containing protein n=1 Tax=Lipomyces oligophaga TaxID=45792 RepID=UPI0034CD77C4
MGNSRKLIIDCDPGIDDVLALILALNCPEVEILLISLCFGNVNVTTSVRNVVATFQVLETDSQIRAKSDIFPRLPYTEKYASSESWPVVALGSREPVSSRRTVGAEYFHGLDGLGDVHTKVPEFAVHESYVLPFLPEEDLSEAEKVARQEMLRTARGYKPTTEPSWREILRVLREEPLGTVTLVAIAPLSNIARAAMEDPVTFSRVKEVICMGGNIDVPGNMTPFAEFNFYADVDGAAIALATSSRTPSSTLPPCATAMASSFDQPDVKAVTWVLVPLDMTSRHRLRQAWFDERSAEWDRTTSDETLASSALLVWMGAWLETAFRNMDEFIDETWYASIHATAEQEDGVKGAYMNLHDPLTMYYAVLSDFDRSRLFKIQENVDMRIETVGQFTWGMCIVDRRKIKKRKCGEPDPERDIGDWLVERKGNRINVAVDGPGSKAFSYYLLDSIFESL